MTDPTSYAAGIEAAARVCEQQMRDFLSVQYATGQPASSFAERFACGKCIEAIRALAPSRGGGSGDCTCEAAPHLVCAVHGYDVPPPPVPAQAGYVDRLQLREDGVPLNEAPPTGQFSRVPAQAESGEVTVEQFLRGRIDTLLAEKEGLKSRTLAAEARCRELEGEVADWRKLHDGAQQVARDRNSALNHVVAERDRLTRAAETAREALEPFDRAFALRPAINDEHPDYDNDSIEDDIPATLLTYADLRRATEALATLSAALGGKE